MTGEQLLHGLWAILPEIILLLLGILVITIDLIKRGQTSGRTFGYVTIAGALVALAVVFYQMLNQQPLPAVAFAGMVLSRSKPVEGLACQCIHQQNPRIPDHKSVDGAGCYRHLDAKANLSGPFNVDFPELLHPTLHCEPAGRRSQASCRKGERHVFPI